MPAWINKSHNDTSVYDWELYVSMPGSLSKIYKCKKTGRTTLSEVLPRNKGDKVFVKIADEWKQDKTVEVLKMIENYKTVKDIIE